MSDAKRHKTVPIEACKQKTTTTNKQVNVDLAPQSTASQWNNAQTLEHARSYTQETE